MSSLNVQITLFLELFLDQGSDGMIPTADTLTLTLLTRSAASSFELTSPLKDMAMAASNNVMDLLKTGAGSPVTETNRDADPFLLIRKVSALCILQAIPAVLTPASSLEMSDLPLCP